MVRRHPRPTHVSKELDEIQGDGKHSHLERRHYRELRACRRSPNRKSIIIRRVALAFDLACIAPRGEERGEEQ